MLSLPRGLCRTALVVSVALVPCAGFSGDDEHTAAAFFPKLSQTIGRELAASIVALSGSGTPPAELFGEPLGGPFTWSSFGNSVSRFLSFSGSRELHGQPLLPWIRRGLDAELDGGGTTFSQLFAADLLDRSCENPGDLASSPLWAAMPVARRDALRAFLDVRRFYNEETGDMGGRPNNYLAVALLIEAHRVRLGLADDAGLLDRLFARCLGLLQRTGGFLDDHRRFEGSFDRYHHEFVRFLWLASEMTGRTAVQERLQPMLVRSGRLWWDLLHPVQFHASSWGRSLHNSWDDTFEQAAFFAARPALAPAPSAQLAAVFSSAVDYYFTHEYDFDRHLNRMLDPGRGTWSYSGRDRIWGSSVGTLGKLSAAAAGLRDALQQQGITKWPARPVLEPVNRWELFQPPPLRPAGVWIHRQPGLAFVLPVVGNGALADYLPAPRGLPGLQTPVQQTVAAFVPFVTLEGGNVVTTCQGADAIVFDPEGNSLSLTWRTLPNLKGVIAADGTLGASSRWSARGRTLEHRVELTARASTAVAGIVYDLPVSGSLRPDGQWTFEGPGYRLGVSFEAPADAVIALEPPANDAGGRGAFEPVTGTLRIRLPARTLEPAEPLALVVRLSYDGAR